VADIPPPLRDLPLRSMFLLRRPTPATDSLNNQFAVREHWVLSDKAADVFELDPGEYFEVELPLVPLRFRYGDKPGTQRMAALVAPCYEALKQLPTVPGTVAFNRFGVSESAYELDHKLGDKFPSSWAAHVEISGTEPPVVADALPDPVWHERYPHSGNAKAMAEACMKLGGRLQFLSPPHPTDYEYRRIVDEMAPYGMCIVDGALVHDPKLTEKRLKARRSRDKAEAAKPEREEARRREATRADEEELATIKFCDSVWFIHAVARSLFDAAMKGILGVPPGESCYTSVDDSHLVRNVVKAYDLWHEKGRHPDVFSCLPTCIGSHQARALVVFALVVERATESAAKARKRAKAAGMRPPKVRVLNYLREVLAICRELYAERDSREPPFQEESECQSVG